MSGTEFYVLATIQTELPSQAGGEKGRPAACTLPRYVPAPDRQYSGVLLRTIFDRHISSDLRVGLRGAFYFFLRGHGDSWPPIVGVEKLASQFDLIRA
jgi:hypothetical protein